MPILGIQIEKTLKVLFPPFDVKQSITSDPESDDVMK